MFVSGGDHGGLRNGNMCILSKVMSLLFFAAVDGHRQAWIYGLVESGYVVVDVILANLAVSVQDVTEEGTVIDYVESFDGVVKFRIINRFDGFGHLFYTNLLAVLVVLPVLLVFYGFGAHALAVGYTCSVLNIGILGWLLRGGLYGLPFRAVSVAGSCSIPSWSFPCLYGVI